MSNVLFEGVDKKRGLGRGLGSLFGDTKRLVQSVPQQKKKTRRTK